MHYITPHYYSQFSCIDKKCPASCCKGWQIVIDSQSLEHYKGLEGEKGDWVRQSIDWEERSFKQVNRRCVFLNDENLCDLYLEYGEKGFCSTCRMYPRHVEEFDGIRELSLSLSCPAAASIIVGCREKTVFQIAETEEEETEDYEFFDYLFYDQLQNSREAILNVIQDRTMDLRHRSELILNLGRKLQECVEEMRFFDMDNVTGRCQFYKNSLNSDDLKTGKYQRRIKEFPVFYSMEILEDSWKDRLDDTLRLLYENGEEAYQNIWREFQEKWGYHSEHQERWQEAGEQLLFFFLYTYFCGAVYDGELYGKVTLSTFSVAWIQEFAMASWYKTGEFEWSDLVEAAYSYAREIEHDDNNLLLLEEWLVENGYLHE